MTLRQRSGRVAVPAPNWINEVRESFEFTTSILASEDDTEQRESLRTRPRLAYDFTTMLRQDELQRHIGDLAQGQASPFALPLPWQTVATSAGAVATDTTVSVASVPAWLVNGAEVVLRSAAAEQHVTVSLVDGNSVTFSPALDFAFPAGSSVVRAVWARAPAELDFTAKTATLWEGQMRYESVPGPQPILWTSPTPDTFEGLPVFATRPNWAREPRISMTDLREVFDPGRGLLEVEVPVLRLRQQHRLGFTFPSRGAAEEFIGFFCDMRGQRGSFWMPSWQRDLRPDSHDATTLEFAGSHMAESFAGNDAFNVVAALHSDGSVELNRVDDVTTSGGDSVFTMASSWSAGAVSAGRFSWCPLCRFALDRLEVSWITATVAEAEVTVQTIKNDGGA